MHFARWASCGVWAWLSMALLVSLAQAQAPAKTEKRGHPTAEEVSRQVLSTHPKPRDEAEKRIIAVMEDMDLNQSRGQAHMMEDYFKAITENRNLETVLVDASKWGMCITRKMR